MARFFFWGGGMLATLGLDPQKTFHTVTQWEEHPCYLPEGDEGDNMGAL